MTAQNAWKMLVFEQNSLIFKGVTSATSQNTQICETNSVYVEPNVNYAKHHITTSQRPTLKFYQANKVIFSSLTFIRAPVS